MAKVGEIRQLTARIQHRSERFEVCVPSDGDVSLLAAEIARRAGVEPARQRLICNGKVLNHKGQPLSELPRGGASEFTVMLLPSESKASQARRQWGHWQQQLIEWLSAIMALLYKFFHSLLVPGAYAGDAPRQSKAPAKGPPAADMARMAAFGGGG
eukprot:TRINITY_DN67837_c0_g1_i1.p1 TRINITY_DN67837_c0_g1~~TRINITY_DN67837_c0_g1_i1.p1  ORF type:complete len:166 (+),score=32.12 TRINITY_DN67837_c0_g1_i1:33-500(+)